MNDNWSTSLYRRFRNQKPRKSKQFLEWFRKKYPNEDPHHLIGSMGPLKLNDYLLMNIKRIDHNKADTERELHFFMYLPTSLQILFDYIQELEDESK